MIDIHCHIIPGIDDGSPDLKTSFQMAEIALKDGISRIITTPHINENSDINDIKKKVLILENQFKLKGINLNLFTGGEIPFWLLDYEDKLITLANSKYLLVEFPHNMVPKTALKKFEYLLSKGFKIIIAHPERNHEIIRRPGLLKKLLIPGVYTQITAMSLKGSFGRSIKIFSSNLLKKGQVDFIATDSHESSFRIPEISFLLNNCKRRKEKDMLEKILIKNPEMIIKND